MAVFPHDPSLDDLLFLDGQVLVVDPAGNYWVRFVVKRVPATPDRPHGLSYSLTLHDAGGARLIGFDNAHPPPRRGGKKRAARDHRHRLRTVLPYEYRSAAELLADFWTEVDTVLRQRGVFK